MEKLTRLFGRSIRFAYHCFDRIVIRVIQERLDYWTFMLGPKFAQHERDGMDLRRYYFISQVEHAQNIIFKRNHPIHSIFERSCVSKPAQTTSRISVRRKLCNTCPRWPRSFKPSMNASLTRKPRI